MEFVANLVDDLIHTPLFWVISIALVLAWLDHRHTVRNLERYDAWWASYLGRSAARFFGRSPPR